MSIIKEAGKFINGFKNPDSDAIEAMERAREAARQAVRMGAKDGCAQVKYKDAEIRLEISGGEIISAEVKNG